MGAANRPPRGARIIHHGADELFTEQDSVLDGADEQLIEQDSVLDGEITLSI